MLIGMSQERMGELLGLTFQQIQKYEKGVNRIGARRLFDISRILGVPIEYFYESVVGQAAGARGFSENETSPPVLEFISSGEAKRWFGVSDDTIRRRARDHNIATSGSGRCTRYHAKSLRKVI